MEQDTPVLRLIPPPSPCQYSHPSSVSCICASCILAYNETSCKSLTSIAQAVLAAEEPLSPKDLYNLWKPEWRKTKDQDRKIPYKLLESIIEEGAQRDIQPTLSIERINTLAYGEYNPESIVLMKKYLQYNLTTFHGDSKMYSQRVFKYEHDRSVESLCLENRPCVILKTVTDEYLEELLIHKEIDALLSANDPRLSILIPSFYAARHDEDELRLYMEYVPGTSWTHTAPQMTDKDILLVMRVVHGFLSYLHKHLGFVHGDITSNNVHIRGWKGSHTYQVPLIENEVVTMVEMPFVPVLLDFGLSVTRAHSRLSQYYGPQTGTLFDVLLLYASISSFSIPHVKRVVATIRVLFGLSWVRHLRDGFYMPPLPLSCEVLSHDALLSQMKESS